MVSMSAPVFYGDIRRHERVPLPFSDFIGFCKQHLQSKDAVSGVKFESQHNQVAASGVDESCLISGDANPQQVYLAQVPIMNFEDGEKVQLEILKEDINTPKFLETKTLSSINLWMNSAQARSSTHYDPHHNLLCIVSGCKQVIVWPPSASPMLYPLPIYGEASNHSSVGLENPDFIKYPRAECLVEHSQKVVLHAGDALFIPEGWFHQVDSDDLTIAVNFWWRSDIMSSLLEHMDAYYMRRIMRRLTDREMNLALDKVSSASLKGLNVQTHESPKNGESDCFNRDLEADERKNLKRKGLQQKVMLHDLEPGALHTLHELVSLVHDRVNVADQIQSAPSSSENSSMCSANNDNKNITAKLCQLDDDPVAKILSNLEASTLQIVLLAMAQNFPRTLEAFILHLLSPVGAETLTRKFDEMDQQTSEEDRNNFYQIFYGTFDDQYAAMEVILKGKESFAHQAFKNVLEKYLAVDTDVPKPCVERDIQRN